MPELFTVCTVAEAADIQAARPLSIAWVKSLHPLTRQTVDEMLPTPLSPTGEGPPTHWLCALTLTRADYEHMLAFIASYSVPVVAEAIAQPEDTNASQLANRDAWLSAKGLKVVA